MMMVQYVDISFHSVSSNSIIHTDELSIIAHLAFTAIQIVNSNFENYLPHHLLLYSMIALYVL